MWSSGTSKNAWNSCASAASGAAARRAQPPASAHRDRRQGQSRVPGSPDRLAVPGRRQPGGRQGLELVVLHDLPVLVIAVERSDRFGPAVGHPDERDADHRSPQRVGPARTARAPGSGPWATPLPWRSGSLTRSAGTRPRPWTPPRAGKPPTRSTSHGPSPPAARRLRSVPGHRPRAGQIAVPRYSWRHRPPDGDGDVLHPLGVITIDVV